MRPSQRQGDDGGAHMADNPDTVWMTYEDAGRALGIKADSVRRRAASRKWPRRRGNDGLARVGIPAEIIPDGTPFVTPEVPDESGRIREELAASEARLEMAERRAIELAEDRDRWRQLAEKLSERQSLGLVARLFGR